MRTAAFGGLLLGAYVNPDETWRGLADDQRKVAEFEALIGRKLEIDMRYHGWSTAWPTEMETWDANEGRIPMVTWGSPDSGPTLAQINSGSQDDWLAERAEAARDLGRPVFLRPLWEMNGNWSAWDGAHNGHDPSAFIAAWRRMHDIFAREGAHNVIWVWAPNVTDVPAKRWNHWANYYPGDRYVDWVGMDGYNWGTTIRWHHWQSFAAIVRPLYASYAGRKPIMVAETASAEVGGNKAAWIRAADSALRSRFPAIKAFVWFNAAKETNWPVDSSTTALAAFRALANDSRLRLTLDRASRPPTPHRGSR
jgi:hypothetical protein